MLVKKTLLTASSLNDAYLSKKSTGVQTIESAMTIKGGKLTLANSVLTDSVNAGYLRIDPQGNRVIIYDEVNNQRLDIHSSSGSESTYIQTINGTTSIGELDVTGAVDHLKIMNNTGKRVEFGGNIDLKDNARIGNSTGSATAESSIYPNRLSVRTLSGGADAPVDSGMFFTTDNAFFFGETDSNNVIGWMDANTADFRWKGTAQIDSNLTLGGDIKINKGGNVSSRISLLEDAELHGAIMQYEGTLNQFQLIGKTTGVEVVGLTMDREVSLSGLKYKGNTIWHAANDGTGSGLDADLLDGLHGTSFMRTDASTSTTGTITIGTGTTSTLANQTSGALRHLNTNGYIDIGPLNGSFAHIYTDRPSFYFNKELLVNGNTVWNAGNDGAGSGLDADLLDGIHAANFLRGDKDSTFSGILSVVDASATPLTITRNGSSNVNMSFSHSGGTGFLGINATGDLRFGASADLNSAGQKVWHGGNDGTGSGLDADLLDGLHANTFTHRSSAENSVISLDNRAVNDTPTSRDKGIYFDFKTNTTNALADGGTYNGVITFRPYGNGTDMGGGPTHQLGFTNNGNLWNRRSTSTTAWSTWAKMWDSANFDPGTKVNKAGDTMTGALVLGDLKINSTGVIQSGFHNKPIIKDHGNGDVSYASAGGVLILGHTNATIGLATSQITVAAPVKAGNGTTNIIGTDGTLYHQGTVLDTTFSKKSGDTYSGSHNMSEASFLWSRDTDKAKMHFVDYGADMDWLTIDFGDGVTDKVRFRNEIGTGAFTNIMDIGGTAIDAYMPLNMNTNNLTGVTDIAGRQGTILATGDSWLRINATGAHTNGTYFGSTVVRTDREFQVGNVGANFKANSAGVYVGNALSIAADGALFYKGADTDSRYFKSSGGSITGNVTLDSSNFFYKTSPSWGYWGRGFEYINAAGDYLGGLYGFGPSGNAMNEFRMEVGSTTLKLKPGELLVNNSAVWHAGNLTPSDKLNRAGDYMMGSLDMNYNHLYGIKTLGFSSTPDNVLNDYAHIRFDIVNNTYHFANSYSTVNTSGNALMHSGPVIIDGANSHLRFKEGGTQKWHIETLGGNLRLVETGVASRATFDSSGTVFIKGGQASVTYPYAEKSITSTGWYNIATNAGDRASARFRVQSTEGSGHNIVEFMASISYGRASESDITLLSKARYGLAGKINAIRFVTAGTYDTMYLQVYITAPATVNAFMFDNLWDSGWAPVAFTAGTIPTGYTATKLELYDNVKRANIYTSSATPDGRGAMPGDVWIQY